MVKQIGWLDLLRQTAIVVLGIVGAWIAVLFSLIFSEVDSKNKYSSKEEYKKKIDGLFKPLIFSFFIVAVSILLQISIPILKDVSFLFQYKTVLKKILFTSIAFIYVFQIHTLLLSLLPFIFAQQKISLDNKHNDITKRY